MVGLQKVRTSMTNEQLIKILVSESPVNRARTVLLQYIPMIRSSYSTASPIDQRRLEVEAIHKIAAELGVTTDE